MKRITVSADSSPNDSGLQIKAVLEAYKGSRAVYFRRNENGDIEFAIPETPEEDGSLDVI